MEEEEQEYLGIQPMEYEEEEENNSSLSSEEEEEEEQEEEEIKEEEKKEIIKPKNNFLNSFKPCTNKTNLVKAKREQRTKEKKARKKKVWEEKVAFLQKKTKEYKDLYKNKTMNDIRRVIQRSNPFIPPTEWLPPKWTPKNPETDSILLQVTDIDDIQSIAESWESKWHPSDLIKQEEEIKIKEEDSSDEEYYEKLRNKRKRMEFANKYDYEMEDNNNNNTSTYKKKFKKNKQAQKDTHSIPILRMHCLDTDGCHIMVRVHGCRPYFYAQVPQSFAHLPETYLCEQLTTYLEDRLSKNFAKGKKILNVSIEDSQSVMGFHFKKDPSTGKLISKLDRFFKITVSMPSVIQSCKTILTSWDKKDKEAGFRIYDDHNNTSLHSRLELFDCEMTLPFLFITDNKTSGQAWFTLKAGSYKVSTASENNTKTNYQVELDTKYDTLEFHDPNDPKYAGIATSRILSFDIECAGKKGRFPIPEEDKVISLSAILQDSDFKQKPLKAIFTWRITPLDFHESWKKDSKGKKNQKTAKEETGHNLLINNKKENLSSSLKKYSKAPLKVEYEEHIEEEEKKEEVEQERDCNDLHLEDAEVWVFNDEEDMLLAFSEFMRAIDADVLTGFNILNFDIPYLLDRARKLDLEGFPFWGPTLEPLIPEYSMFSSAAHGQQERCNLNIPGIILYDFLRWIKPELKLKSYTLNNVAETILKQKKDDLHHSKITSMFYGPAHARERLFRYNMKDSELVLQMIKKRLCWVRDTEMARVCKVVIPWLMNRGQGIKTMAQLQPRMKDQKLLRPYIPKPPRKLNYEDRREKFDGAIVLPPVVGLHKKPVACLDYNSLYPSIMITWNISYDTMIDPKDLHLFHPDDYYTVVVKDSTQEKRYFVKQHIKVGLLPQILKDLLSSRGKAKVDMKKAEKMADYIMYDVFNSRQLALKVSANSVYGFPGAFMMPCPELSAAVTFYGRGLIDKAKKETESFYCRKNGLEHDCRVLYGDTDSIMVEFGPTDLAQVSKLGFEAAARLNAEFKKNPNNALTIEFEKMFVNFLLLAPKNYAAYNYSPYCTEYAPKELLGTDAYKLDMKGIETIRRDKIGFTQNLSQEILIKVLKELDPNGAIEYCKEQITNLLQGKVDLSELILSKGLQLYYDEKSTLPAHARLAQTLKKRDPASAPRTGDRVKYVNIMTSKDAPKSEQAEDPWYAMVNHLPINYLSYFQSHVKNAVKRLLDPIIPERLKELWDLPNKVRVDKRLSTIGGPLSAFMKPKAKCLRCHMDVPKDPQGIVCPDCVPFVQELKAQYLKENEELQTEVKTIWDNCKTCVGKDSDENDCNNQDCKFLFRRWIKKDQLQTSSTITKKLLQF